MPRENRNMVKARLLVLAKMFYELTDDDHQMTIVDIIDYLTDMKVPANNKTVRDDIALLQDLGFDIVKVVSRPNTYFWGERTFEMPELKLLIDAVSSSRFITDKKSRVLSRKLLRLASANQRGELKRNVFATNRAKTDNEEIYYTVDVVNRAINQRRKIAFKYTEYGPDLQKTFRNGGEVYELSPYALFWNEDFYYVVGWSDKHENVPVFRTDRLYKPEILKEKAQPRPEGFKLEAYSRRIFEMYDGEQVRVKLLVRNDLMKYIVDRFGDKVKSEIVDDGHFTVDVEVSLSPTFYAWVFTFGGGIRILAPEKARDELKEMAKAVLE